MVLEFILWLLLSAFFSQLLQGLLQLSQLICLLIAAPSAALIISLALIIINSIFRAKAIQVSGRVDKLLPPLRSGGLPRVQVSCQQNGKNPTFILTPEDTPEEGAELSIWVWGRRALLTLPPPRSAFRILGVCAVVMALAGLGYLCTLLLPDPTGGQS